MLALTAMAPQFVDTHGSNLKLYVGIHTTEMPLVTAVGNLVPANVMVPSPRRSWVALTRTQQDAAHRAQMEFEEKGLQSTQDSLVMLTFEFTALGFGHYTLADQLVEQRYGHFRFYGDLPLLCSNNDGNMLVSLTDVAV